MPSKALVISPLVNVGRWLYYDPILILPRCHYEISSRRSLLLFSTHSARAGLRRAPPTTPFNRSRCAIACTPLPPCRSAHRNSYSDKLASSWRERYWTMKISFGFHLRTVRARTKVSCSFSLLWLFSGQIKCTVNHSAEIRLVSFPTWRYLIGSERNETISRRERIEGT